MKAISPMVASVLLIAFTVAVGGFLITWFGGLFTSQATSVTTSGSKAADCGSVLMIISEARYNSSTPPASRAQYVNVSVAYKSGTQPLKNVTVEVSGGGLTNSSSSAFTAAADDFRPGSSVGFQVNITGGAIMPPDVVTARAYCSTTYPIVSECKKGQPCMVKEA